MNSAVIVAIIVFVVLLLLFVARIYNLNATGSTNE